MTEDQLEQETLGWLAEVGYTPLFGPDLSPDGPSQERADYRQVLLFERLRSAIARLNPDVPPAARTAMLRLSSVTWDVCPVCVKYTISSPMLHIPGSLVQAQTLATLRDTLLPRLISGQLRLPEAIETVEEVAA